MYTWGYIKEATLAKMDISVEQAIDQNLMNKMPFYANEAITQITASIKPKRAYAEFEVIREGPFVEELVKKYQLDDTSFLYNQPCDESTLTASQKSALHDYNSHKYVNRPIQFPDDFFAWSDEISYKAPYKSFHYGFEQMSPEDYKTYGGNKIIFLRIGFYRVAYYAKWFKILPTTDDDFELDCPDDILECLPSYIASQLYKIDDEVKSAILRNEYEMMIARIDENDYASNKVMQIGGDW